MAAAPQQQIARRAAVFCVDAVKIALDADLPEVPRCPYSFALFDRRYLTEGQIDDAFIQEDEAIVAPDRHLVAPNDLRFPM